MKNFLAKIWIPALLVAMAAIQSFGIDISRAIAYRWTSDSLSTALTADTTHLDSIQTDTLADTLRRLDTLELADTLELPDSLMAKPEADTLFISARDTIKIPDSLQFTDPFFYKYYIAVKDSTTRFHVRDSLIQAGDTLEVQKLDSLYIKDSTEVAVARFNAWYSSLTRRERKKYDAEQALPALIAASNRKMEIKDSIKSRRDSVIKATPRILETFAFPDSLHYKRIVTWKHDRDFHDLKGLRDQQTDSSFNYNFHDYNFYRDDLNASWLGVIGSPVQLYDYFKRQEEENAIFYSPYQIFSYTPATLPN